MACMRCTWYVQGYWLWCPAHIIKPSSLHYGRVFDDQTHRFTHQHESSARSTLMFDLQVLALHMSFKLKCTLSRSHFSTSGNYLQTRMFKRFRSLYHKTSLIRSFDAQPCTPSTLSQNKNETQDVLDEWWYQIRLLKCTKMMNRPVNL